MPFKTFSVQPQPFSPHFFSIIVVSKVQVCGFRASFCANRVCKSVASATECGQGVPHGHRDALIFAQTAKMLS